MKDWKRNQKEKKIIVDTGERIANNELRDYIFVYEPRDYIFVYKYDKGINIIKNANSFKDAVHKLCINEGVTSLASGDIFGKAVRGFDNDDIDGIISLYNQFSNQRIVSVFLIDKKIYGQDLEREEGGQR